MINQKTENAVNVLKYCSELCTDIDSIFEDVTKALEGKRRKETRDFKENTFTFLTDKKDGWLNWECYFEKNGLIRVVLMLVAKGKSVLDDDLSYCDMMEYLGVDPKVPLLCFYGVFKPVDLIKAKYFDWWITYLRDSDTKEEWLDFDINNIAFDKEIIIKTQDWNDKHKDEYGDYNEWFSEAKIKIKPILSIQSRKDVETIADELNKMTI